MLFLFSLTVGSSIVPKQSNFANVTAQQESYDDTVVKTSDSISTSSSSPLSSTTSSTSPWTSSSSSSSLDTKLTTQLSLAEEEEGSTIDSGPGLSSSVCSSGQEENRVNEEDQLPHPPGKYRSDGLQNSSLLIAHSHQVSDDASIRPSNFKEKLTHFVPSTTGYSAPPTPGSTTGYSVLPSPCDYSRPEVAVQPDPGQEERSSEVDGKGFFGKKISVPGSKPVDKPHPPAPKPHPPLQPYKMPKEGGCHGYALIINNISIAGREKRLGAEKDDENLCHTFNTLGYRCQTKRDQTADQIRQLIASMIKGTDHTQCDSFVLCLLSHGDSGKIYGVDDRSVYLDEIKAQVIACRSLVGKPKIFIVQSCRGGRLPEARAVEIDDDTSTNKILLPQESDLFFGYATTPFTKACRFTDIGSWYILELCKALKLYKELDLISMVQYAHYQVATKDEYVYEVNEKNKDGTTAMKKYKQSPQMVSTLIRPVWF